MSREIWNAVDGFIEGLLLPGESSPQMSLNSNRRHGLPAIDVSPVLGKLLYLLARISGSRRILEIGTLGGYSTIWLASALPSDGKVVTLELDPHHADVARANFATAGLTDKIELRVGPALETLPKLQAEGAGPFDFIFIDADKPNNPHYLSWALSLSRPGTVLVCDNVVREGAVLNRDGGDANVEGARAALSLIGADPRLDGTAIQTVGSKGYDGFALAVVR